MPTKKMRCNNCNAELIHYLNPVPTVDVIIEVNDQIVLIERRNTPLGWALPGGFVDYGEDVETAAVREAGEETGLECKIVHLLGVYSDPKRDPRSHTISTVFVTVGKGVLKVGDDAARACLFFLSEIPSELAFDHSKIIQDYMNWKTRNTGKLEK